MSRVLIHIARCVVPVCAVASLLAAQEAKPAAMSIPLRQATPGYQELLSGPPATVAMKSGLVVLAPGKSVGKHSTEDHEEIVIVLEGTGQMVLSDGTKLDIGPNATAYSPPGTEHDVINTGSGDLRYVYVVSAARRPITTKGGSMQRVTGLGGVFFKAKDPNAMYAWYEKHLGIKREPDGSGAMFHWRDAADPEKTGLTVWSIFPENTKYFGTGNQSLMMNYIVDDLSALLAELKAAGVAVDPKVEEADYGKFGWITDPEGNRIELWELPKQAK
jgi:quercetin dioxygenase-like cupin family protein/predicted enzyme related to lactoylglutathione lyase